MDNYNVELNGKKYSVDVRLFITQYHIAYDNEVDNDYPKGSMYTCVEDFDLEIKDIYEIVVDEDNDEIFEEVNKDIIKEIEEDIKEKIKEKYFLEICVTLSERYPNPRELEY